MGLTLPSQLGALLLQFHHTFKEYHLIYNLSVTSLGGLLFLAGALCLWETSSSYSVGYILSNTSSWGTRVGIKGRCKEGDNTLDVFITHYMIGLNMLGTWNKPGLNMSVRCCGCRSSQFMHIPGRHNSIGGTVDEENGALPTVFEYLRK